MVVKACRAVLTERCRLMCKQRGRQRFLAEADARNLGWPALELN